MKPSIQKNSKQINKKRKPMEYKFAYEKLMAEHKLKLSDLPDDARAEIKEIQEIERAIALAERKGQTVKDATYEKQKRKDKHVVAEILDMLNERDGDEPPAPATKKNDEPPAPPSKKVEPDPAPVPPVPPADPKPDPAPPVPATKKDDEPVVADPKGLKIDEDFAKMLESGKTEFTLEEVKSSSKTAYSVIFDSYEEGGENGIETTHFELKETKPKVFTLRKL